MERHSEHEKLQKLMRSYVPEFAYEPGGKDAGSVLTDLCGDMMASCEERYEGVIDKHRIQYLNLFDGLIREPVSASRGYVQFQPVEGYEGLVPVPKGTRVLASGDQGEELVFSAEHGITATDVHPELIVVTDRELGKIVKKEYRQEEPFTAFGIEGTNSTTHRLYLCFEQLFDGLPELDLRVHVKAAGEKAREELLSAFTSSDFCWSILEPDGEECVFPVAERDGDAVHLKLSPYIPQKTRLGQKEGYYLALTCIGEMKKLYLQGLSVSLSREGKAPGEIRLNGNPELGTSFYPFGKPLGLYNETVFEDEEVLSRRGAKLKLSFRLDYRLHEERPEVPELDLEYKAIMKKPKKPLSVRAAEVLAEDAVWEYRSLVGWKPLFREPHRRSMFNGSTEGAVALEFTCPEDMADYEENGEGRIRVRLLQAENIYKMPAVYKCPMISVPTLSYSYEEAPKEPDGVVTCNNFDEQDITESLKAGGGTLLFYETENRQRTMYLGFDRSMAGLPFSLYFDIENYGDRPVRFRTEYLTEQGFLPVRTEDYTEGFCGSGNLLLMIPQDAVRRKLYGYEGYFIRFINENKENPEYELPLIRGIYPNMVRVVNVNTVTEEFYLDNLEDAVSIQLSQQNLLKARVEVLESHGEERIYVEWKPGNPICDSGRICQLDMASGELQFRKHAFAGYPVPEDGPQIRVSHSNYGGSKANVPADRIRVPGTAIRYLAGVTNPFPTYGGYDGYTEETTMDLVAGMLRTRGRAVTESSFFDMISQAAYGVRKVRCCNHTDAQGNREDDSVTIAVLVEEYEKGAHVFSGVKRQIRERLLADSALTASGKMLTLIQPHFIRMNVRVWMERESMEQAYELQQETLGLIRTFLNPLEGGMAGKGWEIGELPTPAQLTAFLRTRIEHSGISRMVMTALLDGREVAVDESFYENRKDPFAMAVSGEHMVYIEVSAC
mgnify:CR=1 FL=1